MENQFRTQSGDPDSQHKFNQIYVGIICGIIGPIIGFFIYYLMQFSDVKSFSGFFQMFLTRTDLQSKILSLCLIFNLVLFFVFLKFDFRSAALGILYATFGYIPIVLYLKFF